MPNNIPYFRVFVSSPSDVNVERKIVEKVITDFPYRPAFRDRVAFRLVMWDKDGADTALRATLTPQEAINEGLPMPSACDLVVVVFWSRMGSRMEYQGRVYESGTHFELMDAIENGTHTEPYIYRCEKEVEWKASDLKLEEKQRQYKRLQGFFESDVFYHVDGSIKRSVNQYSDAEHFRTKFETLLEEFVVKRLKQIEQGLVPPPPPNEMQAPRPNETIIEPQKWEIEQSPFPGLRSFKEADAPIFFGRGLETAQLVAKLEANRIVAVTGASGSGKSSLVGAGLLPQLRANAIEGSKDWHMVEMHPGAQPIDALSNALQAVDKLKLKTTLEIYQRSRGESILTAQDLITILALSFANQEMQEWVEVLIFIDQFEELFTQTAPTLRESFLDLMEGLVNTGRVRVVITMRADFYPSAVALPRLAEWLRNGAFPLSAPQRGALQEMIERPAQRAQLVIEEGLVGQILDDTGNEPGNLALMAYALDELYRLCIQDGRQLTFAAYGAIGRVQGAIGTRAEQVFKAIPQPEADKEQILRAIFQDLVDVNPDGNATRRPYAYHPEKHSIATRRMVEQFTHARLLTPDEHYLQVAHEALLREWGRLAGWIKADEHLLRIRRRILTDAQEWERTHEREDKLYTAETLREAMQYRQSASFASPLIDRFLDQAVRAQEARKADEARRKAELEQAIESSKRQAELAQQAQRNAEQEASRAMEQKQLAQQAQRDATQQREIAQKATQRAEEQKQVAEQAQRNAEQQASHAKEQERLAQQAQRNAQQESTRASEQRARARLATWVATVLIGVALIVGAVAFWQANTAQMAQAESEAQARLAETAQAQVSIQIAALDAIAPGATQGALWQNWVETLEPSQATQAVDQVQTIAREQALDRARNFTGTRNSDWEPYSHVFEDGVERVLVPVGCFQMGSTDYSDEQPVREQCITEPFWLDKYEVTNALYGSVGCSDWSSEPDQPRNCVTWIEAQAFCEAHGGNLPTEAQWEYAARGVESWVYPWGNEYVSEYVIGADDPTYGNTKTAPVGSRPEGASWVGTLDQSGNVWEWTATRYDPYPYELGDDSYDSGDNRTRVLRGGSFSNSSDLLRSASRNGRDPLVGDLSRGFRCARS